MHYWTKTQRKHMSDIRLKHPTGFQSKESGLNVATRPEVRRKISEKAIGIKNSQASYWKLISPNNKTFLIDGGIKRKLPHYDLDYQMFVAINTNKTIRKSKNGWKLIKINKD